MNRVDRRVRGFVTEDIRHEGDRVGFMIELDSGESRVLSHVDYDEPSVGKYGVDLDAMDWLIQRLANWSTKSSDLFIADEIGKMELKHDEFSGIVEDLLSEETDLLATIPATGPDFIDQIRAKDTVRELKMTKDNQQGVQRELIETFNLKATDS